MLYQSFHRLRYAATESDQYKLTKHKINVSHLCLVSGRDLACQQEISLVLAKNSTHPLL